MSMYEILGWTIAIEVAIILGVFAVILIECLFGKPKDYDHYNE